MNTNLKLSLLLGLVALCAVVAPAIVSYFPATLVGAQVSSAPTLQIAPSNTTVNTGNTQFFLAIYDPDGSGPLSNQNVTNQASWNSSNSSIASSQNNGAFLANQSNVGTVTINASYLNVTAQATLTVTQSQSGNSIVQTQSATNISQTSATLNALVNSNSVQTTVWFEYGTTQSLGQITQSQIVNSGNFQQNISVFVQNLSQNTTYYFRAVSQNQFGTNYGTILSFVTGTGNSTGNQPQVFTQTATNITQNSATLQASVNPNTQSFGYTTNAWFEYGTTQSLGQITPTQSINTTNFQQNISSFVNNLSQNTTYYFRAVAQNQFGTSYGNILSFTTTGNFNPGVNQAPIVWTRTVSGVGQTIATFRGAVNAMNNPATVWFEYGATRSLGSTIGFQSANGDFPQNFEIFETDVVLVYILWEVVNVNGIKSTSF